MDRNQTYRRGDIFLADLDPVFGSEQGGTRPVVILQNDTGNFYSPTLIVAPMTSHVWKKTNFPTHYYLTERAGLNYPSIIMLEQITTIDKGRIKGYLGRLNEEEMWDVDRKVGVSLGLRDMAVRNTATGGLYHHEKDFRDNLSHRWGKREIHPGI